MNPKAISRLPDYFVSSIEWISVEDKLPEPHIIDDGLGQVIVYNANSTFNQFYIARYEGNGKWHIICDCEGGGNPCSPTHWMPIPQPKR